MKKYLFLLMLSTFILPMDEPGAGAAEREPGGFAEQSSYPKANFDDLSQAIGQSKSKLLNILNFKQEELDKAIKHDNLFVLEKNLKDAEKDFFKSLGTALKNLKAKKKLPKDEQVKLSEDQYNFLFWLVRGQQGICDSARALPRTYFYSYHYKPDLTKLELDKKLQDVLAKHLQQGNPTRDIFSGEWAERFCDKLDLSMNRITVLREALKPDGYEYESDSSSSQSSFGFDI